MQSSMHWSLELMRRCTPLHRLLIIWRYLLPLIMAASKHCPALIPSWSNHTFVVFESEHSSCSGILMNCLHTLTIIANFLSFLRGIITFVQKSSKIATTFKRCYEILKKYKSFICKSRDALLLKQSAMKLTSPWNCHNWTK